MKIVIVGAVAGGASTVARTLRLNGAEIILIERGAGPSFANFELPHDAGQRAYLATRLLKQNGFGTCNPGGQRR